MTEVWKRLLEVEKRGLNRPKGEPSLRALDESGAAEKEEIVWKSSEGRIEIPAESPKKELDHEEEFKPALAMVAALVDRIRKTVVEIRDLAKSSRGKFKDPAFSQEFHRRMTEYIDHSDADLSCFLDYLRIRSPVQQANMVHVVLVEAIEKHKKKLMDRKIRIVKKQFEKDLPNASVHIEELRFILNGILEYVAISAAPNWSIALLTRSLEAQESAMRSMQQRGKKCVEIVFVLGDDEKISKNTGTPREIRTAPSEDERSWILQLVNEIVHKNQGSLKLSADTESRSRMISLILPVERRKVVYYENVPA